jgi:hypothetical protein
LFGKPQEYIEFGRTTLAGTGKWFLITFFLETGSEGGNCC